MWPWSLPSPCFCMFLPVSFFGCALSKAPPRCELETAGLCWHNSCTHKVAAQSWLPPSLSAFPIFDFAGAGARIGAICNLTALGRHINRLPSLQHPFFVTHCKSLRSSCRQSEVTEGAAGQSQVRVQSSGSWADYSVLPFLHDANANYFHMKTGCSKNILNGNFLPFFDLHDFRPAGTLNILELAHD